MRKILRYKKFLESKVEFDLARNVDLPADREIYNDIDKNAINALTTSSDGYVDNSSKSDTVVFSEEEDYYYPNDEEFRGKRTHGATSHAIKHLIEFDKEFMIKMLKRAVKIARNSDEDLLIINGFGEPDNINPEDINNLNILNTLDRIQDKVVIRHTEPNNIKSDALEITETEESLLTNVIQPIRSRYKQYGEYIINKSVELDNNTENDIISFDVDGKGVDTIYYHSKLGLVMLYDSHRDRIKTLFKINTNIVDWLERKFKNQIDVDLETKTKLRDYVFRKK